MHPFIIESLKPEVFWNAVSAMGTLAAVIVALYLPAYLSTKRHKNICTLLNNELSECLRWIKDSDKLDGIPEEHKPLAKREYLSKIDTQVWDKHSGEFSVQNPKLFIDYKRLFSLASAIKEQSQQSNSANTHITNYEIIQFKRRFAEIFKVKRWYQFK